MDQIRVLLVDDHTLLRQGLRNMLELNKNIVVVGEASEGDEAVRKTKELMPEVVLMDITLPGMNGIQATQMIKENHPEVNVIILTMHVDEGHAFEAIEAGASGYLVKSATHDELVNAIQVVHKGEALIHSAITKRIMEEFIHLTRGKVKETQNFGLTEREMEVLEHLCQGASNKGIAEKLFISLKTVKSHLRSIFKKLHVSDRTQAVAHALREGMIK